MPSGIGTVIKEFFKNKTHLYYFILYVITVSLSFPLESIVIPILTGKLINKLYTLKTGDKQKNIKGIIYVFLMIIGAWILTSLSYYIMNKTDAHLIPEFSVFFRNYIIRKLYLKYQNHMEDLKIGVISTKLIELPLNMTEFIDMFMNMIFPRLFIVIVITFYFLYLDYRIGLIIIVGVTILYFLQKKTVNGCLKLSINNNSIFENLNEINKDKLSNLSSIYSSNKVNYEINKSSLINNIYRDKYKTSLQCINKVKTIGYTMNIILFIFINSMALYLYVKNKINIGVLISVFLTVIYLLQYLMDLSFWSPKIIEYMGNINNSKKFLEDLANVKTDEKPPIYITNGSVEFKNMSFGYGDNLLFSNMNFKLNSGRKACIVGKSGSGKSSIIKLLMGYYPISNGTILIDGQKISDYNVGSIRQNISYIHQSVILFNLTVYENIIYGLVNDDVDNNNIDNGNIPSHEQVNKLIKDLHLENVYKNLPDGIDTNVGVNGDKLSGGQRQITFLLREIISDKKLFILDEPTSALDPENRKNVQTFIKNLKNKTVIIITHDNDFANYVDDVYMLKDGHLSKM